MRPFVAIDFETANEKRRSACSVGLVRFNGSGEIEGRFDSLIHPHEEVDYFNPVNIMIHGIRPEDVADAPSWMQIADEVKDLIGDKPLVAHNMAFDGYILSDLASLYELEPIKNRRFCTVRLARKVLAGKLERNRLDDVFDYYFPDLWFDHHDATADAEACGLIFARMQQDYSFEKLEELCPEVSKRHSRTNSGILADQKSADDLIATYGGNAASLSGERVVFTGTLQHGTRAAIQQLVAAVGGTADKGLTKHTTMLVVGIPNPRTWAEGNSASRKMLKAAQLRQAGSPVEVLSEEEFFNRLTDDLQPS